MSVKIVSVNKKSKADKAKISSGDILISIDGKPINDVLDYLYHTTNEKICVEFEHDGKIKKANIKKQDYEDIGLNFDTYLMDNKRRCANKCIFCFIDQLPPNMRDTLYFKDDDTRLSFLQGNYVTLTNLSDSEIDRIIELKVSPINISVHTMDPDLRVMMTGNKNARRIVEIMNKLNDADIKMCAQLVLCRDINDNKQLEYSLNELYKMYPNVMSVAVVPAGLTKFRDNLFKIENYDKSSSRQVIETVQAFAKKCYDETGDNFVYAADEFYIKAQLPINNYDYYGEFLQLENGVGMVRLFIYEFRNSLKYSMESSKKAEYSFATGVSFYPYLCSLLKEFEKKYPNIKCNVYAIENNFFGKTINVAGLLCGCDIIEQLKDKPLGQKLFLSQSVLRHDGDMLLDNTTVEQLSSALNIEICFAATDGSDLVDKILEA